MPSEPSNLYLTCADLAKRWSVTEDHIRCLIRRGELRAIDVALRCGHWHKPRYRVPMVDVEAFERRRTVEASTRRRQRRQKLDIPRYV